MTHPPSYSHLRCPCPRRNQRSVRLCGRLVHGRQACLRKVLAWTAHRSRLGPARSIGRSSLEAGRLLHRTRRQGWCSYHCRKPRRTSSPFGSIRQGNHSGLYLQRLLGRKGCRHRTRPSNHFTPRRKGSTHHRLSLQRRACSQGRSSHHFVSASQPSPSQVSIKLTNSLSNSRGPGTS